jgi:hypothetical protein
VGIPETAARDADQISEWIKQAKAALATGDAAVVGLLLDEPPRAIERVCGPPRRP